MSEMVERVAKAIEAQMDKSSGGDYTYDQEGYLDLARVAIAAMRQPSQEVRHAVWNRLEKSAASGNLRAGYILGDGHADLILSDIVEASLRPGNMRDWLRR